MAEKDPSERLRRAVKENNLFLVKRLIQRTDMRNTDSSPRRYTSLAWAAVLGHEETFEFLLNAGHDERELTKDAENNTILMLLADQKPTLVDPYLIPYSKSPDSPDAMLRMARLYYDRYPDLLDWSNSHGMTAVHLAAIRGNESFVRMLCDLGADVDLADNLGNTPLHYASMWGHVPIVQLLIERGCQHNVKNNAGFTALEYAYSFTTREALQETVRMQYELNKEKRRHVFAQAAARGSEWRKSSPIAIPPPVPAKDRELIPRLRSGSGTSRTTATSDSGDYEGAAHDQASFTASSSPSRPSTGSSSPFYNQTTPIKHGHHPGNHSSSTNGYSSHIHKSSLLSTTSSLAPSALSPVASRMRERDADAMEKYLLRNRSGSSSTDNRSVNDSINGSIVSTPLTAGIEETQKSNTLMNGSMTPRRLRPSFSAAQLRTPHELNVSVPPGPPHTEHRSRSGTNPTSSRRGISPVPQLSRSSSISNSLRPMIVPDRASYEEPERYIGPPSQYAQFPEPPLSPEETHTPTIGSRRKALQILGKPLAGFDSSSANHRRGMSATSVRGSS